MSQPDKASAAPVPRCELDGCPGLLPDGMCPNGYGVTCESLELEPPLAHEQPRGSAAASASELQNERSKMTTPVYRDAFRDAPVWKTPRWYHIGDRVRFCGMLLRCGVDHYAGDQASHPWDPGWGWGDGASLLWTVLTPEGMTAEADAARSLAEGMRERVAS